MPLIPPVLLILLLPTILAWMVLLCSDQRRAAFFRQDPFTQGRWGPVEIFLALFLFLAISVLLVNATRLLFHWDLPLETADTLAVERKLWINSLAEMFAVLLATLWIASRNPGNTSPVGWTLSSAGRDVRLALLLVVLCIPGVYLVQFIVTQLPGMKYEHPFIRLLLDSRSPRLWFAIGFSAIVVAPIAEEFFFRSLLQGWLERLLSPVPAVATGHLSGNPAVHNGSLPPASPTAEASSPDDPAEVPKTRSLFIRCAPILLTSEIFAAAHFQHGGGWVALLLLSLGLGFLYHKTHRLLPCILLHMTLNATSLGLAYVSTRL